MEALIRTWKHAAGDGCVFLNIMKNGGVIRGMQRDRENKAWMTGLLIAANVIVFLLCTLAGGSEDTGVLLRMGAVTGQLVSGGQWWRMFTAMFLHIGFLHLLSNMFSLFVIGSYMEKHFGHVRFLILYLCGGFLGYLFVWICDILTEDSSLTAGASGAIFALLGGLAAATLFRRECVRDVSAPQTILIVLLMLFSGYSDGNISFTGHLGGLIGGFIIMIFILPTMGRKSETPCSTRTR